MPFPWGHPQLLEAAHIPYHVNAPYEKLTTKDPSHTLPLSPRRADLILSQDISYFPSLKIKLVHVFTEASNMLKKSMLQGNTNNRFYLLFSLTKTQAQFQPPASQCLTLTLSSPMGARLNPVRIRPLPLLPGPSPFAQVVSHDPLRTCPAQKKGANKCYDKRWLEKLGFSHQLMIYLRASLVFLF